MGLSAGTSRGFRRGRPDQRARTRIGRPLSFEAPEDANQDGPPAEAPRLPGAPVGGVYQLGIPLGASEGEVFETTHSRMPGRFAMKLLRRGQAAPGEAIDRFRSDVERTAALRHPNIAEVLEIAAMGAEGEEIPIVVMERLEGQTLAERMFLRERMPLSEVVPLVREAANALEAAHQVGVTHGAVRPDNLFLAEIAGYEQGFVKLLDFGVIHLDAVVEGRGAFLDLGADAIRYLAPEQARALAAGELLPALEPRSDQFGLAAVTYRLLSGQDPFPGGDARLVLEAVKAAALRPLDELSGCDLRVSGVVHRAMARDPARRYDSVLAFAKAFEDAAAPELAGARPTPVAINVRPVNEPQPAEVTPEVAVHPSLRRLSEPSMVEGSRVEGSRVEGSRVEGSRVESSLVGPAPQMASPRSFVRPNSVTQVFFAEGERKEQGEWTAADLEEFQDVDPEARFDSFDELPRRRSRFLLPLALLVVVGVGAGVAWTGWRPSFLNFNPTMRTSPATAEAEHPAPAAVTAPAPELAPNPGPAASTATPAPAPAPAPAAALPSTGAAAAPALPTTGAAAAPAAAELTRPRAERATARVPVEAPAAPVAAPVAATERSGTPAAAAPPSQPIVEVPPPAAGGVNVPAPVAAPERRPNPFTAEAPGQPIVEVPPPAAPGSTTGAIPPAATAPAAAATDPAAAPATVAPEPAPAPRDRAAPPSTGERPLRGYVWSPREGRLVPAE
jgi:eukaryotic-like serine/threonine-protein kinase